MKGQRGKKGKYVIRAKRDLLSEKNWGPTLKDYPTSLIRKIRERIRNEIPGLNEKFNTHSRYFGYWKGQQKDKAYIFVQKKNLCINLYISRDDYEGEISGAGAGFKIRYSHNFQGRAGWLTGWYVPHYTKNINVVVKYLSKAFEGNP